MLQLTYTSQFFHLQVRPLLMFTYLMEKPNFNLRDMSFVLTSVARAVFGGSVALVCSGPWILA